VDEGGYGVPSKVGKVNMNGSNPVILHDDIERPEAITIDLNTKLLYFSAQYPSFVSYLLLLLCLLCII
jgi:low density lipoprotein-related protein 2